MRNSCLVLIFVVAGLTTGILANQVVANLFFTSGYSQSMSANPSEAISNYSVAIFLNPKHAAALLNRGSSEAAIGQMDAALADCDKAIKLGGTGEFLFGAHYIRSSIRQTRGDLRGALADLNWAVALKPLDWSAIHERGLLRSVSGDKTGAIEDFSEAIRLNPNHAESYAARGYELDHVDDQKALEDYDQALALDPENVSALYGRSYARFRLGDKEGAVADLKELVKQKPPCADQLRKLLNKFSAKIHVAEPLHRFNGHFSASNVVA